MGWTKWCCGANSSVSHSCCWYSGNQETNLLNEYTLPQRVVVQLPHILESCEIAGNVSQASAGWRGDVLEYVGRMVGLSVYVHRLVIGFPVGAEAFRWQVQRHIKEVRDFQIDLNSDIKAKVLEHFDDLLPFPAGPISRRVPENSKAVVPIESNISDQCILWELREGKRPDKFIKGLTFFVH